MCRSDILLALLLYLTRVPAKQQLLNVICCRRCCCCCCSKHEAIILQVTATDLEVCDTAVLTDQDQFSRGRAAKFVLVAVSHIRVLFISGCVRSHSGSKDYTIAHFLQPSTCFGVVEIWCSCAFTGVHRVLCTCLHLIYNISKYNNGG